MRKLLCKLFFLATMASWASAFKEEQHDRFLDLSDEVTKY